MSQQHISVGVLGIYSQPPPTFTTGFTGQWTREAPTILSEPETPKISQTVTKLENPLAKTHTAQCTCQHCFKASMYPGIYELINITHKCEETMLGMKRPDGIWVRIRERNNHREFPGNYILCNSIRYRNPAFCKYGEEACSFAHNEEEKFLWTLEKDGKFNITEFLIQNRKYGVGKGFSLIEVLGKHGGYFEFICRSCFYGNPPQISYAGPDKKTCSGYQAHSWKDFRILAHKSVNNAITTINPRGFMHKSAFFKICRWLHFCRKMVNANCKFAHSVIERDVWMVERDTDISRDAIVTQSQEIARRGSQSTKSTPYDSSTTTGSKTQPQTQVCMLNTRFCNC